MAVTSGYHSRMSVKWTGGARLGQRLASVLLEVYAQAFQCYILLLKKNLWCVFSCLLVLQWIWEVTSFRKLCDKKTVTQGMTDHLSRSFLSTPCFKHVWVPDVYRKQACVPGRDFCGKEQGSAMGHLGHLLQLTSLCVRDTKIEYAEFWRESDLQVKKFFRFYSLIFKT